MSQPLTVELKLSLLKPQRLLMEVKLSVLTSQQLTMDMIHITSPHLKFQA